MCLTLLCAIVGHRPMSEKRHLREYRGSQKEECGLGYVYVGIEKDFVFVMRRRIEGDATKFIRREWTRDGLSPK